MRISDIIPPGYEDVLGASVAATAVNNPDKLPSSNCTNCQRDFISDEALVMKGCEGGRVLLQGPGLAWFYACDILQHWQQAILEKKGRKSHEVFMGSPSLTEQLQRCHQMTSFLFHSLY